MHLLDHNHAADRLDHAFPLEPSLLTQSSTDGGERAPSMDHLDALEAQSIYIFREAFARLKKLALLWSLGKDSNVMIWLARKAFFGRVPFPALHVDTGMNRLGISVDDAVALAPRIRAENHGITLLMSHLACAQQSENALNGKQIALFREVRLLYRGIPSSLANSSGIFLGQTAHCDTVRPGVALYGVNPTPGKRNPMRPVVELQVHVLQVRNVRKGETVGYDAAWTAPRATRIAVIAAGYADGLLRSASGTDEVPGANAIIALRCIKLSGRFEDFWERRSIPVEAAA